MREYTDQEIRSELYAMWQEIGQQKPRRNGRTEWSNEEAVGSPIKIIPSTTSSSTRIIGPIW
jgi:hypothetical protein